jgi:excisionase family DNA binding protein
MAAIQQNPVSEFPTSPPLDHLLTAQELAEALRVRLSWVYGESRKSGPGSIPQIRVGKYVRFRLADVLNWLSQRAA